MDKTPEEKTTVEKNVPPEPGLDTTALRPVVAEPSVDASADATSEATTVAPASGRAAEPSFAEVGDTLGAWLGAKLARVRSAVAKHRLSAGIIAVAAVALVGAAVILAGTLLDMPAADAVEADALAMAPSPVWSAGDYGTDGQLVATSARLQSRERDGATAVARLDVTYANDSVTASMPVRITYEKRGDAWVPKTASGDGNASFSATAGVDQDKVVQNMNVLLAKAEQALRDAGDVAASDPRSLVTVYQGATFTVASADFDGEGQSETVVVHCTRALGFSAFECDVTARFHFMAASGAWELTAAEASSGAKETSLHTLAGVLSGTFESQDANGEKCFGAKDGGLTLRIENVSGSGEATRIAGTLSVTAHYHDRLDDEAARAEGDTAVENMSFTGTRLAAEDDPTNSTYAFRLTTPEDANNTLDVVLGLGSADDPSRAIAVVTTRHDYKSNFLFVIPIDETASFSDTFVLTRV